MPLPGRLRDFFAPRLGRDLRDVRMHLEDQTATELGAAAFSVGSNIVFGPGQYQPETASGRRLLAHELAHVVQQESASPAGTLAIAPADDSFEREAEQVAASIAGREATGPAPVGVTPHGGHILQRRLLASGAPADIDGLLDILSPPSGLLLTRSPLSPEIDVFGATPGAPASPSLATLLVRVINDAVQNAEIHVGQAQPGVLGGAFPNPPDLTAGIVQRIDLDDIRALEAGAPGNGVAAVAHEIEENFQAHGVPVVPGTQRFEPAHRRGIETESDVAEELVGPGRRVARATVINDAVVPNLVTRAADFENYYLVINATVVPGTGNFVVSSATQAPRVIVASHTIDRFAFGSPFVPFAGRAAIAAASADVRANPLSTITIEGHADSIGSDEVNVTVSTRRAEQAREAMIAAGVDAGDFKERFNIVGRGEADPVGDNDTVDGRALNRRVVITVSRPGP